MARGDLNANKDAVTSKQFAQDWSLDAVGNWRNFREDTDGSGWDLDQQRTPNKVNEITDIAETLGSSWVTPAYDRAGNMTTIPKPADPTLSFAATYDSWNRLVKIDEGANTVAEYAYDGAKRRTIKKTYAGGVLDETRYFFYTEPAKWQVVEERVGVSSNPERQFVWGMRYVDDIVERERDTNGDGTLDERLYGMQDANWNVFSVTSTGGSIEERYWVSPHGDTMIFAPSFDFQQTSRFAWDRCFAGLSLDGETHSFYARHRQLISQFGWAQRDYYAQYFSGSNLYQYVAGNPLARIDPYGLFTFPITDPRLIRLLKWFKKDVCPLLTSDLVTCVCFYTEIADIAADLAQLPPLSLVLDVLDCMCDIAGIGQSLCLFLNGTPGNIAIGIAGVSALSCIINILDILAAQGGSAIFTLPETALLLIEQRLLAAAGCWPGGIVCLGVLDRMVNGILNALAH